MPSMDIQPLLEELLLARGPGGQEDEVREICLRELGKHCDEISVDEAGNVRGLIKATADSLQAPIRVMAHLDEIAMIVKKVRHDGNLEVVALGGAQPICFGVCPVDILGDTQYLPGVLSYGSMHNSGGSAQGRDVLSGAVKWSDVHVITRCSPQELADAGVRPGVRVVLSRHWRQPFQVKDSVAAHFLDDRAPLAAVITTAQHLKTAGMSSSKTSGSSARRLRRNPTPVRYMPLPACRGTPPLL